MYDANFKIILFGDETEGKKILTHKYMINLFTSSQADTLGVDFEVKSLSVNGFKVKLQIWDISGDRRFRDLLPTYISHARGGLFVYDVSEKSSLTNINFWLSLIKNVLKKDEIFPIVAVGVKPVSINQRQITLEESKVLADLYNLDDILECCTKSGSNIEEMFETLSKIIIERSPLPIEPINSIDKQKTKRNGLYAKKKSKKKKKKRKSNH
ncbi:MAG: GTP-binding protein [Candidatus Lokiarchaeota archaeon]|nr:GTP-binding protein [Candidatus Lokiarchaeota archaeon]